MNYTKNYNLPQWELNDLIRMEDFNQMCANIESGLTGNKTAAENKAADLDRKINAANVKADAAQAAAALKPYVTGSYTGTGGEITVDLGFRPSFLIVCGMLETAESGGFREYIHYSVMTAGNVAPHRATLTDAGFIIRAASYEGFGWPHLTSPGRIYDYIAFK